MTRRNIVIALFAWVASVTLYSVVYWGLWNSRPDAFILDKQFNLVPIQVLQARLWGGSPGEEFENVGLSQPMPDTELDMLMAAVKAMELDAASIHQALAPIILEQDRLKSQLKEAIEASSKLMWENVEKYQSDASATEQKAIQQKKQLIAVLEQRFGSDNHPPHVAIMLANERVGLARAEYQDAAKKVQIGEYVLKNLVQFSDAGATSHMKQISELLEANLRRQNDLADRLSQIRERAYSSLERWSKARRARLNLADFIYFSAGVSTTATFGDIIPNSRVARMFVLSQLILSVFIVGYIVNFVVSRPATERRVGLI